MTEPMRENERIASRIAAMCGMKEVTFGELSDSIKEALDSKDSLIQAKEERIKELEKSVSDTCEYLEGSDVFGTCCSYHKAQKLRTLVKELGRALKAMTEFQPKREGSTLYRKDSICHTASPSEHDNTDEAKEACYICKALLLIPEQLRKEMEK